MYRWLVEVNRVGYATREIEVQAGSREEAEDMAINMAGELEFNERSAEYEVAGASQVLELKEE
jgi:hypothetical protein